MNTHVSESDKTMEKKPVASTLKNLLIGESAEFPTSQLNTVKVTANNIQIMTRPNEVRFETKTEGAIFTVTRVK